MAVRSRLLPVTTEPSQYASFRPEAARWGKTRQAAAPARFFTVSGYAPFSVQTMLLRYFASTVSAAPGTAKRTTFDL
jgi:hypothetical protein